MSQLSAQLSDDVYTAPWWLRGGHAQTIWPTLARSARVESYRERLELADGDFVWLDRVGREGPIVVILPGLQGDIRSSYIRGMLRQCLACGWRGVVLNFRGRGEPNRRPYSYHSGKTDDLHQLVGQITDREPQTPLAVVSFSIGANICMRWLGEWGRRGTRLPVRAAVGVSVPFQLEPVARHIERGMARIYQWHLLRSLRRDVKRKLRTVDMGLNLMPRDLSRLKTFRKFDDRITAPLNGFTDADDYYARTRSDVMLQHINVPTLIINARNDPIVPAHLIPDATVVSNHVRIEVTSSGGHVGFVTGRWPWRLRYWHEPRIAAFLRERFAQSQ